MGKLTLLCRNATTFAKSGELDDEAFARFLQQFVDAQLGVYLASGGSGEGHALSPDELRRVYEIGVAICGGKVQVCANPPEQNTAKASREHAVLAAAAGVDVINIYGPAAWHGFKPTDAEYSAYFDAILKGFHHPIALAPNPIIGYTPSAQLIANLCNTYRQVVSVNLSGQGDIYFIELKDRLRRDVDIYVPFAGSLNTLGMGAAGLLGAEANIIPKTHRLYLDLYERGDLTELARVYSDVRRFGRFVAKYHNAAPRWIKMAMRLLQLPGGEGGVREPYLPPVEKDVQEFAAGLLALRIPEIDALAAAAGVSDPKSQN